jgi:hypothetical protein
LGNTEKRPLGPILLIAAGIILLVITITSVFLLSGGDDSTPVSVPNQEIPFPNIGRVDLKTAKSAFDSGQAVFVDVRDQESYKAAHIPGARLIPLSEISSRLTELDPQNWIILYCT